jgi:hypothetical protein
MIVSNVKTTLTRSPAAPLAVAAAAAACRRGRRYGVRRGRGGPSIGGARVGGFLRSTRAGTRPSLAAIFAR